MLRQYELVEKVRSYDPDADEGLINRAYVFSMKAHGDQQRASGDPYFSHPIEVAGILTDLKLDDQTIATAILHDTIEDTVATPEEIEKLFGKDVARLVDGVTKLSKIEAQSENERAAENLRKFLLALSDDIRVLLVKLADRLHNMRTLHHIPSEDKRRRIARETMDIYAPLAERIGMYEMMTEMQTLAFREIEPDAYASITRRLQQLTESGGDLVNRIGLGLQLYLADNGLEAEVTGRQKHPFSIWKKMAERHISFEQLSDVMAFRHLLPDREGMLLPTGDLGSEPIVGEIELKPEADPADEVATLFVQLLEALGDRRIGIRLELAERKRLHFRHHLVHADALGERRVDIHRLTRDPVPLLLIRDMVERPHVVQAVGKLHQQHADVV